MSDDSTELPDISSPSTPEQTVTDVTNDKNKSITTYSGILNAASLEAAIAREPMSMIPQKNMNDIPKAPLN